MALTHRRSERVARRRKSCTGKVKYPSLGAARKSSRYLNERDGTSLSAYKCKYCPKYHLGNSLVRKPSLFVINGQAYF